MTTPPIPAPAPGMDTTGLHTDLTDVVGNRLYTAQKPYRNGVTVYTRSVWGGNGFGTDVTKVAVRDGEIVGVYESGQTHVASRVVGLGESALTPDFVWVRNSRGERERRTTRTRLSKWIQAVKAL
ncbi:hypothetical protein [Nocardioides pakistanensis]